MKEYNERSLADSTLDGLFVDLTDEHFNQAFNIIDGFDFCEFGKDGFVDWFERKMDSLEDFGEFSVCTTQVLTIRNVLKLAFYLVICDRI